jgi:hypothetical protein
MVEPFQGLHRVFCCGWIRVLRTETIIDGDHDDGCSWKVREFSEGCFKITNCADVYKYSNRRHSLP